MRFQSAGEREELPGALVSFGFCDTSPHSATTLIASLTVPEVRNPKLASLGSISWQGWFLLRSLRRDSVSSPLSSLRVCLHSLVCDPFLVPPWPLAPCLVLQTLIFLPPSYRNSCDYPGPTWINQPKPPISRYLTHSH